MTSSRSAGRRNGDPRFSENCHHVFRAFMQLVRWRQIWGTDARFDLLVPSTLTTATNLAGSTVAWQRNARFSENGESGGSIIAQRKESLSTVPVTPAFRPVSRCVRFCGGEPRTPLTSGQTAVLGLCGRLSAGVENRGDLSMDCTTVYKEKEARSLYPTRTSFREFIQRIKCAA